MKPTLFLAFLLAVTHTLFAQDVTLSGKITDEKGSAIPFATVYVKNTTKGTSANSDGEYSINLKSGQYQVQFKAIGYGQQSRNIDLKSNQSVNITLKNEDYQLNEVVIRAGAEDPAYAIIRKAIKKRKTYLNEVNAYTCEVYIKGLQKLLAAPKKFLMFDVQKATREAGLDSNRTGIVYLSESQSKLSFMKPDNIHEELISSKVSGSNRAFSYNRASDLRVNFYENLQDWEGLSNRPLVSPIADNALFYYRYKYAGTTIENGETINKIQVIPRRDHDPCFSGYIYILEDSWRLQGLGLYITKKANLNFVDTLKVNEEFFPVNGKVWMPASIKFDFTGGLFGFRIGGYFISLYKDYDINPQLDKKQFAEVLRITKGVNKKDSVFWEQQRPIPLTPEEKTDYKKKAILAAKRESKPYLDSLDRENNKIDPLKVLLEGYHHRNRYDHEYYNFNSILGSVFYNTVQGLALDYGGSFTKQIDSVNNKYLSVYGKAGYGFSNKLFYGSGGVSFPAGPFMLNVTGGSDVLDMNDLQPISRFMNTAHTLLNRQNFEKLYQKKYALFSASTRINGGWLASGYAEWADRKWLPNTADYSLFHPKGHEFTSNNPFIPDQDIAVFPQNQSFKIGLRTSYDFSDKYETYPNGRRYLPSKYPTIGLNLVKGFKNVLGSDVDYTLLSADIQKSDISLGMYGKTSFYVSAGKFLNTNSLFYTDYRHFAGNEAVFYQSGINKFLLLDYYNYSTGDKYLEGHLEHNFSGFITNKIPLIRKLKLQEIVDINYLYTPTLKNYTELGFGLQTNTGLRVMYGTSFNNNGKVSNAIRIGLSF
ncbi:carboxypeptidase-like regulatory domain-containing protein [Inquilinus sp. KBS0705]|nr:carboxypeptidase-like regulatory domain-containing protein [Inquilinus sp. KBS0705]